jgi:hypothetical protein
VTPPFTLGARLRALSNTLFSMTINDLRRIELDYPPERCRLSVQHLLCPPIQNPKSKIQNQSAFPSSHPPIDNRTSSIENPMAFPATAQSNYETWRLGTTWRGEGYSLTTLKDWV